MLPWWSAPLYSNFGAWRRAPLKTLTYDAWGGAVHIDAPQRLDNLFSNGETHTERGEHVPRNFPSHETRVPSDDFHPEPTRLGYPLALNLIPGKLSESSIINRYVKTMCYHRLQT